jgi:hypothetical protein
MTVRLTAFAKATAVKPSLPLRPGKPDSTCERGAIVSSWNLRQPLRVPTRLTLMKKEVSTMEFTFSGTVDWVVGVLLLGVTVAGFVVTVFA